MTPKALIFDFDGTLAELKLDFAAMREEVHAMARQLGFAGAWPAGLLLEEIEALSPHLPPEFPDRAMALIEAREMAAAAGGSLFPFSRGLLSDARGLGLDLAIVSRNTGQAIRRVFPEIDSFVDAFLPRDEVSRPKPDPEHISAALRLLRKQPRETWVVGDHTSDIEAAHRAGCPAVAVASGKISFSELSACGAELVLHHAGELLLHLP